MKTQVVTLLIALLSFSIQAQYKSVEVSTQIISINYEVSKQELRTWLLSQSFHIISQNDSKTELTMVLHLSETQFSEWSSFVLKLGHLDYQNIQTVDNADAIKEIELELDFLKKRKLEYDEVIQKYDSKSESFQPLWREKQNIDERIFNLDKKLLALSSQSEPYHVRFTLIEEMTSPQEGRVSFVNMPGLEYSYYKVTSPVDSISSSAYQGYLLKYLFTKGKSYASVGAYKSLKSPSDTSRFYSELFVINFGQDFYSRHLGRGNKKMGNLYSGYTLGYMIATNDSRKSDILYLSPSVGLELFKNKYLLWDVKANYMIPFTYNRNLRGIAFNTSLNFVF